MTTPPEQIGPPTVLATHTEMTLIRPLDQLPEPLRSELTEWLIAHRIAPHTVARHAPIERDAYAKCLTWREDTDQGRIVRTHYPPVTPDEVWPAPFPAGLPTGAGTSSGSSSAKPRHEH